MAIYVTEALKHEIKTIAKLSIVAAWYTNLERDGQNLKGICPFKSHGKVERTPSFTIFPPSEEYPYESFYCFGCHAGSRKETEIGNSVIDFIMAMENLDYYAACQFLCDKLGIHYEEYNVNPEVVKLRQRKTQENVNYYNNLMGNKLVLDYLKERGVSTESIKKFRIGLTFANDTIQWRKNRLVFGITDVSYDPIKANTIALGYRSLQGVVQSPDGMEYFPNETPNVKYRNDGESAIFKKNETLFGLNYAVKAIRATGYATVVEGYLDVVLMHQAGFENTVAPMGTSFTEGQMDLLKRYCSNILFFLDGDSSGLKAMRRILPLLLERGFSVLVIEAPSDQDPADLVNSFNQDRKEINNYIKSHSVPALQWVFEKTLSQYDAAIHKARMDALSTALPLIDKVVHRESKISYITSLSDRLGIDASAILLTENKQPAVIKPQQVQNVPVVQPVKGVPKQIEPSNLIEGWTKPQAIIGGNRGEKL